MDQPFTDALTVAALKLHMTAAPWMLTGSVAGIMYGRERTTLDIDIVVDMEHVEPEAFAAVFGPEYFLDSRMVRDSLTSGILFNAIPLQRGPKLDLIPLDVDDPFKAWAFDTREPFDWHGTPIWAANAVALAVSKLLWARESGSERQLADVRAIMAYEDVESHADFQHWTAALGLQALVEASKEVRYDA